MALVMALSLGAVAVSPVGAQRERGPLPLTVSGVLLDDAGAPVGGVELALWGGAGGRRGSATTGPDGSYVFNTMISRYLGYRIRSGEPPYRADWFTWSVGIPGRGPRRAVGTVLQELEFWDGSGSSDGSFGYSYAAPDIQIESEAPPSYGFTVSGRLMIAGSDVAWGGVAVTAVGPEGELAWTTSSFCDDEIGDCTPGGYYTLNFTAPAGTYTIVVGGECVFPSQEVSLSATNTSIEGVDFAFSC